MADALLYPYAVLDSEPRLTVSNARLDGQREPSLLARENLVDLHSIEGPWRRARLRAHVQLPADRLTDLIDADDEHEVVLTVHCPSTNLRHAVAMEPDPGRPGSFSAEVELERALLHTRARIEAVAAGTVAGVEDRYLARSNAVDVQIAELRIPEISGDLDIAWRPFDQEHESLPALPPGMHDQLSHLELDRPNGEGPRLWLNSSVNGLRRLLDERPGRSSVESAMRLAVFDGIATSAMLAMFNTAIAAAIALDDDDGEPWPGDWKEALLRSMLPHMHPERDVDDALRHALDNSRDSEGAVDVQERAHAAAARHLRTNVNARRAVKALEENLT
jgi:hypothetical protein